MDNPFDIAAPAYARVRPAYPREVVDALVAAATGAEEWAAAKDGTETAPGVPAAPAREPVAVDLGAGTGKMTALLLARGLHLHAVEPAEPMRADLSLTCADALADGRLRLHATGAEDTGLPGGVADLVVAAQSWHWFDAARASVEAARLLRPGGVLAIVWNQMDVREPWVHRLTRIMRSGDVHRADAPPALGEAFTPPRLTLVEWEDRMTTDEVRQLGTTRSSYLRQDAAGRARMQENLRWYLHDHLGHEEGAQVRIPYTTLLWVARRPR